MSPSFVRMVVLFAGLSVVSQDAESQGAMFRGDAWHSGIYESPTSPAFEDIVWKLKTNGTNRIITGRYYRPLLSRMAYFMSEAPTEHSTPSNEK